MARVMGGGGDAHDATTTPKAKQKAKRQYDALVAQLSSSDEGADDADVATKARVLEALTEYAPQLAGEAHKPLMNALFRGCCANGETLRAFGGCAVAIVSNNATHAPTALAALFRSASRGLFGADADIADATTYPQHGTIRRILALVPAAGDVLAAAIRKHVPFSRAETRKHEGYARLSLAFAGDRPDVLRIVVENALAVDCLIDAADLEALNAKPAEEPDVFELDLDADRPPPPAAAAANPSPPASPPHTSGTTHH